MATKTKEPANGRFAAEETKVEAEVKVEAPKFQVTSFIIRGTSPYVQNRFGKKALEKMRADQEMGSQKGARKPRDPKDFRGLFREAQHVSTEGWYGIPAPALRNAMISACRLVDLVMTRAKMSIRVLEDGIDEADGSPLVRLRDGGDPVQTEMAVRNSSGVIDIRPRPMWKEWGAVVRVRWLAKQFRATDIMNLLMTAGECVGIGEGRADSPKSNGMGWGFFTVEGYEEVVDE